MKNLFIIMFAAIICCGVVPPGIAQEEEAWPYPTEFVLDVNFMPSGEEEAVFTYPLDFEKGVHKDFDATLIYPDEFVVDKENHWMVEPTQYTTIGVGYAVSASNIVHEADDIVRLNIFIQSRQISGWTAYSGVNASLPLLSIQSVDTHPAVRVGEWMHIAMTPPGQTNGSGSVTFLDAEAQRSFTTPDGNEIPTQFSFRIRKAPAD